MDPTTEVTEIVTPVSVPTSVGQTMDDESILAFTQNKRAELVQTLTKDGMPTETATANVMLAALRDMSHDVLTKKKIGSEAQASKESARLMVAAVLQAVTPRTGRQELRDIGEVTDVTDTSVAAPSLDDRLHPIEIVPDETTQGAIHDTFEAFEARIKAQRGELPSA